MKKQEPINWKAVDAGYEERIKRAIEQFFGRKKHPKRTAPSEDKQARPHTEGRLF